MAKIPQIAKAQKSGGTFPPHTPGFKHPRATA
jgi:hypothetical protein